MSNKYIRTDIYPIPRLVEVLNELDEGISGGSGMVSITRDELLQLRDDSALNPGKKYRIIDYTTTTIDPETQAADNDFDVIVTALSSDVLSEDAKAIRREGDTYFADSKLEAWHLKYCIDNDTNRFDWADDTNGKGVIYYMKDEFENECPYDFKNIQFKRYRIILEDSFESYSTPYVGFPNSNIPWDIDYSDFMYVYTFNDIDGNSDHAENSDYTISKNRNTNPQGYAIRFGAISNKIESMHSTLIIDDDLLYYPQSLNNIVFMLDAVADSSHNTCLSNKIGVESFNMTFLSGASSNSIGNDNRFMVFGNSFRDNNISVGGCNLSFGNICYSNTFGNYCSSNTFGNSCISNTFWDNCQANTFGNGCSHNTFGTNCESNTFGNGCSHNTFGNICNSNNFENNCFSNTFGNNCQANTFGDICNSNTFGDNKRNLNIENYTQHVNFINSNFESKQYTSYIQNNGDEIGATYPIILYRLLDGIKTGFVSNDNGATWNTYKDTQMTSEENVVFDDWVPSTTFVDYPYESLVLSSKVTSNSFLQISFDTASYVSGNYANYCESVDGGFRIFSKMQSSVTVPKIIIIN